MEKDRLLLTREELRMAFASRGLRYLVLLNKEMDKLSAQVPDHEIEQALWAGFTVDETIERMLEDTRWWDE